MLLQRHLMVIAALGLTSCGPRAFVVVEVFGELSIPDEVDALSFQVTRPGDTEPLVERTYTLLASDDYPISMVLEPSSDTAKTLEAWVFAWLLGVQVASGGSTFTWKHDQTNEVRVDLEP